MAFLPVYADPGGGKRTGYATWEVVLDGENHGAEWKPQTGYTFNPYQYDCGHKTADVGIGPTGPNVPMTTNVA